MFYYVEGTVALLEPALAVIDCGGVGYACSTSRNTSSQLKIGKTARLYTHFYCREDVVQLFGFLEQEELNCFRMLLGVSGVGPKAALAILSEAPPAKLALSIITGDSKLLMRVPGIGKKIAQRIVLELRDKMSQEQLEHAAGEQAAAFLEPPAGPGGKVNHTQEAVGRPGREGQPHAGGGCGPDGAWLQPGGGAHGDEGLPDRRRGGGRDYSVLSEAACGRVKGAEGFEHRNERRHGR